MNNTTFDSPNTASIGGPPSLGLRVVLWFIYSITFSFGNALLLSILHYERYGGDPKKRSLGNRLTADIGLAILLCANVGILPFIAMEAELDTYMPWDMYIRIYRFAFFSIVTFMNLHTLVAYIQVSLACFATLALSYEKLLLTKYYRCV